MGVTNSSIPIIEHEEEAFNTILKNLNLSQIEVKTAYKEFIKCLIDDGKVMNPLKMNLFLDKITGHKNFKIYQKNYFHQIINDKAYNQSVNIRILGCLILILAKGTVKSKIELFISHYFKYYIVIDELTVKDFIRDMIEVNTDKCLVSFNDYLGQETLEKFLFLYSNERKEKLTDMIYSKFEEIEIKNIKFDEEKKEKYMDEEHYLKYDHFENKLITKHENQMYKVYYKGQTVIKESWFNSLIHAQQSKFREFLVAVFDQLKGENIRLFLEKYEE